MSVTCEITKKMKTIGLLGGMSWESTVPYYRIINESVNQRLGGLHSAKIVLFSVDFCEIEKLQRAAEWQQAGRILAEAARSLESAGADFLVLCTNTLHKVAADIENAISIPLLHIADATAEAVNGAGARTVGLLGTRYTMEQDFYRGRLERKYDIKVLIPREKDRDTINRVIFEELCRGEVVNESRQKYIRIIEELAAEGAEGVILGCTEIPMLIGSQHVPVPLFDTTDIHARKAADWALR